MMYMIIYGATLQIKRLVNSFTWKDSDISIEKRADSTSDCPLYDIIIYGGFCCELTEKDKRLHFYPQGVNLGYVALEPGSYIDVCMGYTGV